MKGEISEKALNPDSLRFRSGHVKDASTLARMMAEEINWGRLRDLGHSFLTLLHRHMIVSDYSICYVAEQNDETIGYIAGTTDVSKFYREFLLRYGLIAMIILLPKIFHPRRIKIILRGLTYFHGAYPEDPKAEMLSFAVWSKVQKSGIGTTLLNTILKEFKVRGTTAIKFGTVEATNEVANAFYRRIGCELVRTIPFYNDSQVNVYVYNIP